VRKAKGKGKNKKIPSSDREILRGFRRESRCRNIRRIAAFWCRHFFKRENRRKKEEVGERRGMT